MRIRWKKLYMGRLPLAPLFIVGVLLGIFAMALGRGTLLDGTGLLDEYSLYRMKYMTVDFKALFIYVLGQRLSVVLVLGLLATTYLGLAADCLAAGWYGFLGGLFLSASLLRYGIKGILLSVVGVFPQCFFYVPAFFLLMAWCEQVCKEVCYRKNVVGKEDGKRILLEALLRLLAIVSIMAAGCLLEGYVNPILMTAFLKIF